MIYQMPVGFIKFKCRFKVNKCSIFDLEIMMHNNVDDANSLNKKIF